MWARPVSRPAKSIDAAAAAGASTFCQLANVYVAAFRSNRGRAHHCERAAAVTHALEWKAKRTMATSIGGGGNLIVANAS
jgi:hypothetical protein